MDSISNVSKSMDKQKTKMKPTWDTVDGTNSHFMQSSKQVFCDVDGLTEFPGVDIRSHHERIVAGNEIC